ncbi:MAG: hypothetical protein ACI95K_001382, partial [Lentimonas sp.]
MADYPNYTPIDLRVTNGIQRATALALLIETKS